MYSNNFCTALVPSAPPNNLSITSIYSTALQLSWNEPNAADRNGVLQNYHIFYSIVGSAVEHTVETENTGITLTGLEEYTDYVISVNASTVIGIGPGASVTIRTAADGDLYCIV